jgi:hypothetical protein
MLPAPVAPKRFVAVVPVAAKPAPPPAAPQPASPSGASETTTADGCARAPRRGRGAAAGAA